ncbi:hypothetical protein MNEG_0395 [Monoraphidium neglectum]|uniref:Uncharacterized protein n=1 Tax=Monoraphidium neglectum TaxID=145388 RepID=A0A0D2KBK7_9CHLO|nr:hypothetical protein MNEG_0395 [Monoraphidium neglectum]KIZ07558.1 hypothetical protein MNEG_0395 [Monoraphidium neglectum]|eukprot:XP_013906577.1 hypothetical protein MNEG_0395 [Monoraphidium neglectum]
MQGTSKVVSLAGSPGLPLRWRTPARAAAVPSYPLARLPASLPLLVVALPLLAVLVAAQSPIPFGKYDCLNPAIKSVDGFNLNTATHQISVLPAGFTNAAAKDSVAAVVSAAATPQEAAAVYGTAYAPAAAAAASAALQGSAGAAATAVAPAAVAPTTITIADLFSITYYGTWKLVTNLVVNETYVLYQCGTPNPVDLGVAPKDTKTFQIPLHSLAVPDTTALALVGQSVLKLQDRVVGAPSYCTDACGQVIATKCGFKADPDPFTFKVPGNILGVSDALLDTFPNGDPKSIIISAPGTSPAIRPQWLKFIGAFFNREGVASNSADTRMRNYLRKAKLARAAAPDNKPKVIWISSMDIFKDWGYPADGIQYVIFGTRFKKSYVEDAGGVLLDGKSLLGKYDKSIVDKELFSADDQYKNVAINPKADAMKARQAFLEVLSQADVVVDETYFIRPVNAPSMDALLARYTPSLDSPARIQFADVAKIPAFANQKVVTVGKRLSNDLTGSDWFESAVIETDRVLDDFITIITPQAQQQAITTKWLQRLGKEAVTPVRLSSCSAIKSCTRGNPGSVCANAYYRCKDGTLNPGQRLSHCNPQPSCTIKCQCCANPGATNCVNTCAAAPVSKQCPF